MKVGGLKRFALVAATAAGLSAGVVLRVFNSPFADTVWLGTLALCGLPLVVQTILGMIRGRFAADIVAALAIVAALLLHQYFAGAVIVLMQSGGEALERYAMGKASASLDALLAKAPKVAHRLDDRGQATDVTVDQIVVGDLLLVRPGELIPVDARVIAGRSTVDQSSVTGEPFPVPATSGTKLMSGTLNQEGALSLVALKPSSESQYQQILQLVESARREKPPIQRIADRWAVWFTPLTLLMCAVAWWISRDPTVVLAVLVVATPCPLILAPPVAVIAAISRAAQEGIIVKTGAAIEQMGLARAVVFDKTGTLTLGKAAVSHVRSLNGVPPDEVLRLAAAVEQFSSNHLGAAIALAGRERFKDLPHPTDFRETPGSGVSGVVNGQMIDVGSATLLRARGATITEPHQLRTTAYVAADGRAIGAIEFADRLRHQVPSLMQRLAVLGVIDTIMLTGDTQEAAEAVATQAGIRTVKANLLPGDKVAAVEDLKRRYRHVLMVGDGINDAPALAAATVGIALGAHGTAAPAAAADAVLLVDDISRVADAMAISQRMRRIALQSISAGVGISLALMVIASLGYITPAAGAIMQEALDAAVILNALRAR